MDPDRGRGDRGGKRAAQQPPGSNGERSRHAASGAFAGHRRGARRPAGRQDGRRLRRRGPGERRRPDHGGRVRQPRDDQLHGHPRPRPDLPLPDAAALRRAAAGPDGARQPDALRHRLHRLRGGARGREHRHLGRRPRPHHPGGHRPALAARPISCSRATSSR